MDYKRNQKYFSGKSYIKLVIALSVIAFILLAMKVYAIGIILLGVAVAIGWFTRRPKDSEIDAAFQEERDKLRAAALKKLGIDEEEISIADPIITYAYTNTEKIYDDSLSKCQVIKGKDGRYRTPRIEMNFFCFSENEIHFYYRYASLVSDTVKEGTKIINYKDVVSVSSDTETVPVKDPKTGLEVPGKKFVTDYFSVNVPSDSIKCLVANSSTADSAVNALRALIKQKKNA